MEKGFLCLPLGMKKRRKKLFMNNHFQVFSTYSRKDYWKRGNVFFGEKKKKGKRVLGAVEKGRSKRLVNFQPWIFNGGQNCVKYSN